MKCWGTMQRVLVSALALLTLLPFLYGGCGGSGGGDTSNLAPTAYDASQATDEDIPVTFDLTAIDPEDDPLSWRVNDQPTHGRLTLNGPDCTYTPDQNYYGSDQFSYHVNDGRLNSNIAFVDITIDSINDPPTETGATIITEEDTASAGVTPWVLDADTSDSYTFSILSQPNNGTSTVVSNQLIYDPNVNYNGSDSFTFRTIDSEGEVTDGTANVSVNPVNDVPTSTSATLTTNEDVISTGVTPAVIDVDVGESFVFSILTQPTNGSASVSSNQLIYDPDPNYNGNDSFMFRTTDSGGEYVDGTAYVGINSINDAPTSTSASISTDEDTTSSGVTPSVIDIDIGDSFTFSILTQPTSGSAYVTSNELYYDPNPDYNGADSFTYRATDSGGEHVDGTASVTIVAVNDAFPPVVTTLQATNIQAVSASLNGAIDPNGADTDVWFEYSLNANLSTFTASSVQQITSGVSLTNVDQLISNLTPGYRYYYRAVAQNSEGTTEGDIVEFRLKAPSYSVVDLGSGGDMGAFGFDINNNGWVIGYFVTPGPGFHAFMDNGTFIDLGLFGADRSFGSAINDLNQGAGSYGPIPGQVIADSHERAFITNPFIEIGFPVGGGCSSVDINRPSGLNSNGIVIGNRGKGLGGPFCPNRSWILIPEDSDDNGEPDTWYDPLYVQQSGQMYPPNKLMVDIPPWVEYSSFENFAYGINENGVVVGGADGGSPGLPSSWYRHAYRYEAGTMVDLGTLGGTKSEARGINNLGVIAGWSYLDSGVEHAFLYTNDNMTDIGTLGGSESHALAINDNNVVVGYSNDGSEVKKPFIYIDGLMYDLTALVPDLTLYTDYRVTDLNNLGQVLMYAYYGSDASYHTLILEEE